MWPNSANQNAEKWSKGQILNVHIFWTIYDIGLKFWILKLDIRMLTETFLGDILRGQIYPGQVQTIVQFKR